jgi:rubrerythrin
MDIFKFALTMEQNGKTYYEKLASETSVAGLKTIFTNLAEDEQKHYNSLQDMLAGVDVTMAETTVLDNARNIFQDLMSNKEIVGSLTNALHGYQHARTIEAESIRFYEEAAKKTDNPAVMQLLLQIVNEEKKHYNIMDNLCDFTLAPQNFLAWGEFSNLKEL